MADSIENEATSEVTSEVTEEVTQIVENEVKKAKTRKKATSTTESTKTKANGDYSDLEQYIGAKLLLIHSQKIAKILGEETGDLIIRNAIKTHGAPNIRKFVVTKDNLAEFDVILTNYKNSIRK